MNFVDATTSCSRLKSNTQDSSLSNCPLSKIKIPELLFQKYINNMDGVFIILFYKSLALWNTVLRIVTLISSSIKVDWSDFNSIV